MLLPIVCMLLVSVGRSSYLWHTPCKTPGSCYVWGGGLTLPPATCQGHTHGFRGPEDQASVPSALRLPYPSPTPDSTTVQPRPPRWPAPPIMSCTVHEDVCTWNCVEPPLPLRGTFNCTKPLSLLVSLDNAGGSLQD